MAREHLIDEGFAPYRLQFRTTDFLAGFCEWDTLGQMPDSPGLYAFVLQRDEEPELLRVSYVGLTGHLWMVTKGVLPRGGGARGPQRYGRHKHAGPTRAFVNSQVAAAKQAGFDVSHWLSPRSVPPGANPRAFLRGPEEELITRWELRRTGWNRG